MFKWKSYIALCFSTHVSAETRKASYWIKAIASPSFLDLVIVTPKKSVSEAT